MKIENVIRILDNKEYTSVEYDEIGILKWYDVKLNDGNMIRIEKCTDQMMILYIVPEQKTACKVWIGEFATNEYYIFSNIYNELEREINN